VKETVNLIAEKVVEPWSKEPSPKFLEPTKRGELGFETHNFFSKNL